MRSSPSVCNWLLPKLIASLSQRALPSLVRAADDQPQLSGVRRAHLRVPAWRHPLPNQLHPLSRFDKSNPQAMPDETGLAGSPWPFREAFMTRRMVMIWDLVRR